MNFVHVGVPDDVLGKLREIVENDFSHSLILVGPKTEEQIQRIAKNKVQAVGGLKPILNKVYWGDEKGKNEWYVELMLGYTGTSVLIMLKLPGLSQDYRNYRLQHETLYYFD